MRQRPNPLGRHFLVEEIGNREMCNYKEVFLVAMCITAQSKRGSLGVLHRL